MHLNGEVVQDVVPEPAGVYLGRRRVGAVSEEVVCLRSLLGRDFRVKTIDSRSPNVVVKPQPGEDAQAAFSIRVSIGGEGEQAIDACFTVEESDGRTIEVILPIRYHGVAEE